jgi:hypothetical protein
LVGGVGGEVLISLVDEHVYLTLFAVVCSLFVWWSYEPLFLLFIWKVAVLWWFLGGSSGGVVSFVCFHVRAKLCTASIVRGLNNQARRKVVRDLVGDTRASIVTLQETKLALVDRDVVLEIMGDRFRENFVALPGSQQMELEEGSC